MTRAERIVGWIYDRRRWCAALCAIVTALAAWQATRVGVDNSLEVWFVDDDPALVAYRTFQRTFGSDEVVVVAFSDAGGMLRPPGVELLRRAADRVRGVDGVDGAFSVADVLGAAGSDSAGAAENVLRERVLDDAVVRNRLASRDGTVALLVIRMQPLADIDGRRDAVLARIDDALAQLAVPTRKAGIGVVYAALNRLAIVDAAVLFVAAWALIALVLWRLYRSIVPVGVALAVVATASLWTLGLYGACGRSLNMVTSVMPTLVLVIGVAECVHVQLHVGAVPPGADRRTHVVRSLAFMLRPCLLNALTTVSGLASLAVSPLPVIRDLGVFGAFGIAACFALTLVGCAGALASPRAEVGRAREGGVTRVVAWLAAAGTRRPARTLAAGAALVGALAIGATRLEVDTYTIDFLFADHPVRRDSDFVEARVGPYVPLEFVVRAPRGEADAGLLDAVARWQRDAQALPGVGWGHSTKACAAAEDAACALRVTFGVNMQSARSAERLIAAVSGAADLPAGATAEPAGYLPLYVRMVDHVVGSQVRSFALAFATIFLVIGVAFRSARAALFAVPANVLPVLAILGVMGFAGIRLDVATVTIASVVLALVVDDTVHVLHRLHHELGQRWSPAAAVQATLDAAGRAIVVTTIVLIAGFAVFALAEIKSVIWFGLLIALGLVAGVVADLVLMPALVLALGRSTTGRVPHSADGARRHG